MLHAPKGTKTFYETLIGKPELPNACGGWRRTLKIEIPWEEIFMETKRIQEVKLKWFQIKINYRVLVTNSILKCMGVIENNKCSFCEDEKDSILHYLWECQHVQNFWREFTEYMKRKCLNCDRLKLNQLLVLFGNDSKTTTDICFSHILLLAKYTIYKSRIRKTMPTLQVFLRDLKEAYEIDKYAFNINMQYEKFILKWAPYTNLIQND